MADKHVVLGVIGHPRSLTGVVHLLALPGSPRWGGSMRAVVDRAVSDARAYADAGFTSLIVENFGDAPFHRDVVPAETVAAMTAAVLSVTREVSIPVGVNVLRNDAAASLAVCAATGARFIRVNVLAGAYATDQGVVEGRAAEVMRKRRQVAPDVLVLADVNVKHAAPLVERPLDEEAHELVHRALADALLVTGRCTGGAADPSDVVKVKTAVPEVAVIVASGVTAGNIATFGGADGFIVGSAAKGGGVAANPVSGDRAVRVAEAFARL